MNVQNVHHLKVVSRFTCDMDYLCANFSLPVLDLGPIYVTDKRRQMLIIA